MKIKVFDIRDKEAFGTGEYSVLLGRFDGVHIAHQRLVKRAITETPYKTAVFTFLEPGDEYITKIGEKFEIFDKLGVSAIFLAPFNYVKRLSPEEFFEKVLVKIGCKVAICGFNYRFGSEAAGDSNTLSELCDRYGIRCIVDSPFIDNGEVVSSTLIRKYIREGNVARAEELLGRPVRVTGSIIHGYERARTMGYPTINMLYPEGGVLLRHGVYATICEVKGTLYSGVTNVGTNPTLPKNTLTIETHLIGASGDFYGVDTRVHFLEFLRDSVKCNSLEELSAIIENDKKKAVYFHEERARKGKGPFGFMK